MTFGYSKAAALAFAISTAALFSAQAVTAVAQSPNPLKPVAGDKASLDHSSGNVSVDTSRLPVCPPPSTQKVGSGPVKSLTDPAAPKCAVVPANAGMKLAGVDTHAPLRLDETNIGAFTAQNGGTDPIKHPACLSACLNGVGEISAGSVPNRFGMAATLYAQTPALYGSAEVYNWIGLQNNVNGGNLAQIGISYNNLSFAGTNECSGNNDVNYRPMILGQAEIDGTYLSSICFPQYIFGAGTQTFFAVTTSGNGWWDNWVNWNGVWQDLVAYHEPNMVPSNALADFVPAEVIELGFQYVDPSLPNIPDQQGQIFNGSSWQWWFYGIFPTGTTQRGGYCISTPTAYTNVTAKDNGC